MTDNTNKPSDGFSNPKLLRVFEMLFGSSNGIKESKMNINHRKVNLRLLVLFRMLFMTTKKNTPKMNITIINQSPPSRQNTIKVAESKKYFAR
jgi:hypothetical protein